MDFCYPSNVSFGCIRCGLCCGDTENRNRRILLLGSEIERIVALTSLPISDFAAKLEDKNLYGHEMKKTAQGKCVFLDDDCCTIYSSRPLICRFYPFELRNDDNHKYTFLFSSECPGVGKGKRLDKNFFMNLFQVASAQPEF
ncbi:YkgJ family cysteine cluster protein [Candidatus Bathyarchaeota archaeon]|nr:YkgJ family cysteine cluster protein [Candidatus Bathyarchaeota archaeon]